MRYWRARRCSVAVATSIVLAVGIGIVTDLIPNPIFVRMIPAPWWSYPVWAASAVLSGLLIATYTGTVPKTGSRSDGNRRRGVIGGLLSFLAVGCPTCNKLVVLALGTSGSVTWFAPIQPLLAIGSLALLAVALRARLRTVSSFPVTALDNGPPRAQEAAGQRAH